MFFRIVMGEFVVFRWIGEVVFIVFGVILLEEGWLGRVVGVGVFFFYGFL